MELRIGSIYQLDHSRLPPRAPIPLKSIRIVIVSEETEFNVSVKYPSSQSLERYFKNRFTEICPVMDEKFVMGTGLAGKVLRRRISPEELSVGKYLEEFWLVMASESVAEESEKQEKEEKEEEEEEEEEEEAVTEESVQTYERAKRQCVQSKMAEKRKRKRKSEPKKINKAKNAKKNCTTWPADRYEQGHKHLLMVMKDMGAVCVSRPVLRPELRAEARKKIGDLGLLDHLLKHKVGVVAKGGSERFLRRYNAEGAMEYWLESDDDWVEDPYWTPPQGWKIGDCPTQDPIYAKMLKETKEENSRLKRDMKYMISKKQMEEELAKVRRDMMEDMISKKQVKEKLAKVRREMEELLKNQLKHSPANGGSFAQLEKCYTELLTVLSERFTRIQGDMIKSKVEEGSLSEDSEPTTMECTVEKTREEAEGQAVVGVPTPLLVFSSALLPLPSRRQRSLPRRTTERRAIMPLIRC